MRTAGSDVNSAASTQRGERNEHGGRDKRAPAGSEAVQKFRALLHDGGAASGKVPAGPSLGDAKDLSGDQDGAWRAADLAYQYGKVADPGTLVNRAVATAAPQAAWAELFNRHLKQLVASEQVKRGDPGARVMLRLSDTALEGTELWLTRGYDGWVLHADAPNARVASLIREFGPDLVTRFGERDLGTLEVRVEMPE